MEMYLFNINIFNDIELRTKHTNTLNRISLFLINAKRNRNHKITSNQT